MIRKFTVLVLLMNSFSLFLFSQNEKETPKNPVNPNASKILDQVSEAVKTYDAKKQKFQEDVLGMFDKKETISRSKGDIKILNQLKNEKDNFLKEGKDPTLFFITDQKRSLELAKLSLIKSYEKHIKECLTLKFDFEADELVKELETLKNEKAEDKFKTNSKPIEPQINKNNVSVEIRKNLNDFVPVKTTFTTGGQFKKGNKGEAKLGGKVLPYKFILLVPSNGGPTSVFYNLDKKYKRFHATVAVKDTPVGGSQSPIIFSVFGDEKELWKSNPIKKNGDSEECDIDITNIQELELRTKTGPPAYAWAIWIDPFISTKSLKK